MKKKTNVSKKSADAVELNPFITSLTIPENTCKWSVEYKSQYTTPCNIS